MIKIFDANDRDFSSAGNIIINPIKCREYKKKSLNGWYLDIEIPIKYKKYIKKDKLCVVKTKSKLNPQAFRIGDNINCTSTKISFIANHVMFDAEDYFLKDVRPIELNGINALSYINERTDIVSPFKMFSNVENVDTAYFIKKSLLESWAIIEERWNGVFDADNWNISFLQKVGNDNGESIIYGKNLEHIETYEDWSGVVTKLCPVGYDGIMLPETYLESDVQYEKPYTRKIDFETDLDTEEQTEENLLAELREKATNYLEENKYPKFSYTVKSDINQNLEIGDTIHILHPIADILTEVLEYEYDEISKKVKSLTFGNFTRDVQTKFNNIKTTIEQLNQALSKQTVTINKQTELINSLNKNGIVYIDDNEILILDKLPISQAKNIWRLGLGGIGFSSNGYEGPFEVAITMDGQINANFITTGKLSVDRIEGLFEQISIVVSNNLKDTNNKLEEVEKKNNELDIRVNGLTNIMTNTGGTNIFYYKEEFWKSEEENSEIAIEEYSDTNIKQNTVSGLGYILNNGNAIQKQVVKNGTYTISFLYYKLIDLAEGYVLINGDRYDLDAEETEKWEEKVITIDVDTNTIDFEIISDTDNSFIIADLMSAKGNEKTVWSQNANETITDTVTIGKGIQVNSSSTNTYTRIDADGNRTYNTSTGEVVAEQTDKGTKTKELEVENQATINVLLIQEINGQAWITGIGG